MRGNRLCLIVLLSLHLTWPTCCPPGLLFFLSCPVEGAQASAIVSLYVFSHINGNAFVWCCSSSSLRKSSNIHTYIERGLARVAETSFTCFVIAVVVFFFVCFSFPYLSLLEGNLSHVQVRVGQWINVRFVCMSVHVRSRIPHACYPPTSHILWCFSVLLFFPLFSHIFVFFAVF